MEQTKIKLALVDDHTLFRKGMISLIDVAGINYEILFEADNGIDLQKKLSLSQPPDIILLDINMPEMDGYESVAWLRRVSPGIKVLVVSMIQEEESIMRMLKLGVKGYLSKDVEPQELRNAITAIISRGFYYTDYITGKLVHSLQHAEENGQHDLVGMLNNREREFIQYACSELTYNEIAEKMYLSPKTIEGYRYNIFDKLQVKSRVGLALFAIKHGLVHL